MSGNDKLERELEALLADDDSRLATLYRNLPKPEPGADVDAAVLAMARRHATPARTRRPRWPAALAAAAVVVVAAGVVWRIVPQMPTRGTSDTTHQQRAIGKAAPNTAASPVARKVEEHRAWEPKPESSAKSAMSKIQIEQDKAVAPSPRRLQSAPLAAPAPTPSAATETSTGATSPAAAAIAQPGTSDATRLEQGNLRDATTSKPAYSRAVLRNAKLYPESWLAAIRRLIRDGKRHEAAQNLDLFHRKYPDYELPADLKDFQADPR